MNTVPFGPPTGASEPDPFAEYDAAYVFGALSPDERTAYERHLQHCDDCSAAVAAMAGIPGLLARVPLERLTDADETPVPDTVLPRLVAQVSHERQRSRFRTGAVVLLAAACVIALLIGVLAQRHPVHSVAGGTTSAGTSSTGTTSTSPSATKAMSGPALAMSTVRQVGVSASVQIQDVLWGTKVAMRCTEAPTAPGALPYAGVYYLLAVGTDGARHSLSSWHALPGKTVTIEGDTGLRRADISALLLVDADREVLLKLDL